MRKLLIATLLLIADVSFGQTHTWEKLGIPKDTFNTYFGTETQYSYQKYNLESQSQSKALFIWCGAKFGYLYHFADYLTYGYNVHVYQGKQQIKIIATPQIGTEKGLTIIAHINSRKQIAYATITGTPNDVISLFVDYWEFTPMSVNELKSKRQIVKEFVSDKVAIRWTGTAPIITITKAAHASMDLFPLEN